MATCEQCGNDYDKSFAVTMAGRTMIFDSFECAIQALAPTCPNCGNRIIGHGVEHNGSIFCCVHCAKQEGVTGLGIGISPGLTLQQGRLSYRTRQGAWVVPASSA